MEPINDPLPSAMNAVNEPTILSKQSNEPVAESRQLTEDITSETNTDADHDDGAGTPTGIMSDVEIVIDSSLEEADKDEEASEHDEDNEEEEEEKDSNQAENMMEEMIITEFSQQPSSVRKEESATLMPPSGTLSKAPSMEINMKFKHILKELVSTEKVYLKDLTDIIEGYQKKLVSSLEEDEIDMIFGNIEDLLEFHTELYNGMEYYVAEDPYNVGEIFTRFGLKRFMVYEKYYLDHMKSLSYLFQRQEDSQFLAMLVRCQTELQHQLPLADYLLKPVQRLLKYPLLFSEMIKATGNVLDGFETLHEASKLLKDVADNINEIKRKLDVSKYVESLQNRLLSWDGPDLVSFGQLKDAGFFKVSDATNKKSQRQVLLFELGILICKPRAGGFVSVKHFFKMNDLYLQTMLNEALCFRLTLAHNKKVYFTFYCKNQDDKQYWIAKIKKVIIDFHTQGKKPQPPPAAINPKIKGKGISGERSKSLREAGTDPSSPAARRKFDFIQRRATHRKRFSTSAGPVDKVALSHAPVSKAVPVDQRLMHNPFAQAGGFEDADTPDKKIAHEVDISKRTAIQHRRSGKHNRSNRDRRNESSRVLSPSTSDVGDNDTSVNHDTKRESTFSSASESSNPEPNGALADTEELDEEEALAEAEAEALDETLLTGDDSVNEDIPGAYVVRVNFPDTSHTSMIVKEGDTVKQALASRLERRELKLSECIVQVPDDHTLKIRWDDDFITALEGHKVINVTKVKGSLTSLRKNSRLVIRVPSGNLLISHLSGEGVMSTPDKAPSRRESSLKNILASNPVSDEPIMMAADTDEEQCGVDQAAAVPSPTHAESPSPVDKENKAATRRDNTINTHSSSIPDVAVKTEHMANPSSTTDSVPLVEYMSAGVSLFAPVHGPQPQLPARFARTMRKQQREGTSRVDQAKSTTIPEVLDKQVHLERNSETGFDQPASKRACISPETKETMQTASISRQALIDSNKISRTVDGIDVTRDPLHSRSSELPSSRKKSISRPTSGEQSESELSEYPVPAGRTTLAGIMPSSELIFELPKRRSKAMRRAHLLEGEPKAPRHTDV